MRLYKDNKKFNIIKVLIDNINIYTSYEKVYEKIIEIEDEFSEENNFYIFDELSEKEKLFLKFTSISFSKENEYNTIPFEIKNKLNKIEFVNELDFTYNRTIGRGNLNPKYLFIGMAPGSVHIRDDLSQNNLKKIFQSRIICIRRAFNYTLTSYILKESLYKSDIFLDSFTTNLFKYPVYKNRKVLDEEYESCFNYLLEEINSFKNLICIFCLGNDVFEFLQKKDIKLPIFKLLHPSFFVYKNYSIKDASSILSDNIKEKIKTLKSEKNETILSWI